ncbi:MAG: pentapeptide repeat-containing protein [Devosia sp.]|uniref:pentapeptide repeat-containing protein n=1 Tax=Devosia sp. TaxID=1871048 RepID=UPI001AC4D81E|nr:pentapeptide repeat-containing protein [Devosia sp.]MBN9315068.1 pentapeptide repeat-containing protein [Devosia sp.]
MKSFLGVLAVAGSALFAASPAGAQEAICRVQPDGSVTALDGGTFSLMGNPWKDEPLDCWQAAADASNNSLWEIICSGMLPTAAPLEPTRQSCKQLSSQVRYDYECQLDDGAGNQVATRCDSYFALQAAPNLPHTRIEEREAYARAFRNQPFIVWQQETPAAFERREQQAKVQQNLDQQPSTPGSPDSERARKFLQTLLELKHKYPGGSSNQEYLAATYGSSPDKLPQLQKYWDDDLNLLKCNACDFSGMDLRKEALGFAIDWNFLDVSGSSFAGTRFGRIEPWHANFSNTDLTNAAGSFEFINSVAAGALFNGTSSPYMAFLLRGGFGDTMDGEAILEGTSLYGAVIDTLVVSGISMRTITLDGTRIGELHLDGADATGVDFGKSRVGHLSVDTTTSLRGANLGGQTLSLSFSDRIRAQKVVEGTDFTDATLEANITNAALVNGLFGTAIFCRTDVDFGSGTAPQVEVVGTCR